LPVESVRAAENAIRLAYAERLEGTFKVLMHQNMSTALQAGSRALVYCVQAGAWDRLGGFASRLVTSSKDPRLLEALVPHLQTAAESAPEGQPRWSCLCYLADALRLGGRPDASLPFYEQAAVQVRAVAEVDGEGSPEAWGDVAWITGNWAIALILSGSLDAARKRNLEAAEAGKKGRLSGVAVVQHELDALRIEVLQGKIDTALPEVKVRLARLEEWWERHRVGKKVPEVTDGEALVRALDSALDILGKAESARGNWESALACFDALLKVEHAVNRPTISITATRYNRANVLMHLPNRFSEAKAELEDCLDFFRDRPDWSAKVLGSLAGLLYSRGDLVQAIAQQRRALAIRDQLPDPIDRAVSHGNLGNWLENSNTLFAVAESSRHRLAALIYSFVVGLEQQLQDSLHNYAVLFHRAHAAGTVLAVPRVTDLLADPAFAPLEQWLRQRQVPLDQLQSAVDQFLAQARQAALASPKP
jgi:tetratricopeptide (TPR) repeat protein